MMKKGNRGRPKGSVSCVRVRLSDLNKFLRPEASVEVSVKHLKALGLVGSIHILKADEARIEDVVPVVEEPKEGERAQFTVEE